VLLVVGVLGMTVRVIRIVLAQTVPRFSAFDPRSPGTSGELRARALTAPAAGRATGLGAAAAEFHYLRGK
jgi:hypothetical protein